MSATVDSLSIKVDASARGANQQLDKLVQKMIQLRSAVNGINIGNLNTMAASIQNFSKAAAGLNQVKTSDFTRMAKSIEKLSNIRKGELNRAATAITNISKAFSNIGNVSDGAEKIAQLAQGISRLGYKSTTQAIQNIPLLTNELKNMMSELSKAPNVSNNLIAMTNAMANLGAQASGIRSLGSAMNGAGRSGNGFFGIMKKGISSIKNFTSNVRSATNHNRSFASTIGLLCAKFWTLQRAISEIGKAIESSMNYIEEFNYFDVVTEKIGKEWSEDYKKYGYENAEAYSKSFSGRMREDIGKLTGYNISEDGNATYDIDKNLGLDLTKMTNYSAGIMNVTNSLGMTGEASIVTSKAMSKLAGDMSSFKNVDLSTVMNNFQSGLIGQSRALYKYGIDITNATLQQYAYNNGIKKSVTEMTQAEKMQLRMIAILDQSKSSWGDLAKTIQSPSNQFRLFKTNVAAAGRTLGNIFLPIVAKVLPYVNGLAIAVNKLLGYIFKITGMEEEYKKIMGDSGSGYSDAFEGLEEDADTADNAISGIGDSADKSADKVKKLAKQLMGFDELNVINTTESSSGKNGSDGESGGGGTIDLTDQLSAALADYEKVWNDAYKNMTNDAEEFADKLTKLFKDAWKSGDGSDIGSAIAGWLNKGMNWVSKKWKVADAKLKKICKIFATALNGFTYSFKWSKLGTILSNAVQTYLDSETEFFKNVDWIKLGEGVATSLNKFIGDGKTGPIQSYLKKTATKLRSAIEFAFGTIKKFKFKNLGKAIGTGINDFFDTMGKEGENGKTGWEELGETITGGISGLADAIAVAVKTIKWEKIGEAIKELISSINMEEIGWSLGNMGSSFANAFYKLVKDKETWKELGTKVAEGISGFFKGMSEIDDETHLTGWQALGKDISKSIEGISTAITTALDGVPWEEVGQAIADFIKNIEWEDIVWNLEKMFSSFVEAFKKLLKGAGMSESLADVTVTVGIGAFILSKLSKTKLGKLITKAIGKTKTVKSMKIKIKDWILKPFKSVGSKIKELFKGSVSLDKVKVKIMDIGASFTQEAKKLVQFAKDVKKLIKGGVTVDKAVVEVGKLGAELTPDAKKSFKVADLWKDIKTAWEANGLLKDGVLNLTKGAGKTESIIGKIALAGISFGFPDPTDFEIEGFLEDHFTEWFNDIMKDVPGFNPELGVWQLPKTLLVDIPVELGGFVIEEADDALTKLQKAFTNFMTGGEGGTPTLNTNSNKENVSEARVVKYKADTTDLDDAIKKADADHSNTTTFGSKKTDPFKETSKLADKDHKNTTIFKGEQTKAFKSGVSKISNLPRTKTATVKFNGSGDFKAIKDLMNNVLLKPEVKIKTLFEMTDIHNPNNPLRKKADGGIFSGGSWHNIAKYASGGLPGMGQMFVAREAGPELVGTIGGHTAVMNNNQIVASVSDGVFNALAPVLTSLVNAINTMASTSSNGNGDVYVQIDGDNIARVVRRKNSDYRKRTGKGMFD